MLMRIFWEGLKEGRGGGGAVLCFGLLGTSIFQGGGVGGGVGLILLCLNCFSNI